MRDPREFTWELGDLTLAVDKAFDESAHPRDDLGRFTRGEFTPARGWAPAGAAEVEGDVFRAYHMTDDPARVSERVAAGGVLTDVGHEGQEFGAGLYVSSQPGSWQHRGGQMMEVEFTGRFAHSKYGSLNPSEVQQLRDAGYDGVMTESHMGAVGQTVIWDAKNVRRLGVAKAFDESQHPRDRLGRFADAAAVVDSWPDDPTDPDLKQVPFAFDPTETQRALEELDEAISNHDAFTRTTRDVPLANLRATQPSLVKEHLQHYLAQPTGTDRPQVIVWNDNLYLLDGHHRAAVEQARGAQTLRVEYIERKVAKDGEKGSELWDLRDRVLERLARIAKAFDEAKHPRDAKGRFASADGPFFTGYPTKSVRVYHGTSRDFDPTAIRSSPRTGLIYLTSDPHTARTYQRREAGGKGSVHSYELSFDNPLVHEADGAAYSDVPLDRLVREAKAKLHDGIIVQGVRDSMADEPVLPSNVFIAFSPNSLRYLPPRGVVKQWDEAQHPRDELGRFRSTLSVATLADLHERFAKGVTLFRGVKPAGAAPADPGDFGVGRYLTTSRSRAREYGTVQAQSVVFKNPLILTAEEAYAQLADRYGTISGVPGDPNAGMGSWVERLKGSQRATHDLQQLGYDGLVVVHDQRGELEVVEFPKAPVTRSWDGMPFRHETGEAPHQNDTPPQRTVDGHFVVYHGTSLNSAQKILAERRLKPDDLRAVGFGTTPGAAAIYGSMKRHDGGTAILEVTLNKDFLQRGNVYVQREVGGSGKDQFLIAQDWQPGVRRGGWPGVPPEAIVNLRLHRVNGEDITKAGDWDGFYVTPEGVPYDDTYWAEVLGDDAKDTWDVEAGWLRKWVAKWREDAHPRHPKGSPMGGKFAPKGAGGLVPVEPHPSIDSVFGSSETLATYLAGMLDVLGPGWYVHRVKSEYTNEYTSVNPKAPALGGAQVTLSLRGPDKAAIVREFYRDGAGHLNVHHGFFQLPPAAQGKGMAKDLMAYNLLWYQTLGVHKVELNANLDVGGYAWARMGFTPTDASQYRKVAFYVTRELGDVSGRLKARWGSAPSASALNRLEALTVRLGNGDGDALHELAGARWTEPKSGATVNLGQELLKGSEWRGRLFLSDTKGVRRMEEAIAKRGNPYHKPGGTPEGGQFTTGPGDVGPVGSGFTMKGGVWVGPRGKRMSEAQLKQLKALGVPPTYTDVRFNTKPSANRPKVWATDRKGRVKRFYSKDQHQARATTKYARVRAFETAFPKLEAALERDLRGSGPDTEAAACLYLISRTALRPGSDRDTKAAKQAYGATTLESRHVKVEGPKVSLQFTGKNGKAIVLEVTDPRAKSMLKARAARGGRLFQLAGESHLRDYLKAHTGADFKVKDLRTRYATAMAHKLVKELPLPINKTAFKKARLDVAKQVAAHLGNAASMTLNNYIDPVVWTRIGGDKWS